MAKRVQRLGFVDSTLVSTIGFEREFIVDMTNWTLTVHDGSTPGGYPLAKADMSNAAVAVNGTSNGAMSSSDKTKLDAYPTYLNPFILNIGSAGAPTYSFVGSTTTGLYSPTTGACSISVAGTEVMRWDGNGVTAKGTLYAANTTASVVVGSGEGTATITNGIIRGVNAVGTNVNGGRLVLSTGQSTGNTLGTYIQFMVSLQTGISGSAVNPLVTAGTISQSGNWNMGGQNSLARALTVVYNPAWANAVVISGGTTGSNAVTIQSSGSDSNVSIQYVTQGTGTHQFSVGPIVTAAGTADQSKSIQTPTTGFSITLGQFNKTMILNPAGTLATGTIIMPATPIDGGEYRITSTATITSLTVSPNAGQTIKNAPTSLVVSSTGAQGFAFIYDASSSTWFRTQ